MGTYDTLKWRCPVCKNKNYFQSKMAGCRMGNYTVDNAPLLIIADMEDEGERGLLLCNNCDVEIRLKVAFITNFYV